MVYKFVYLVSLFLDCSVGGRRKLD
uniref:Uncharacterized protein n=1 Tax=Tetranychus urticae TaxID=32264 RepID=T1L050_TETUR